MKMIHTLLTQLQDHLHFFFENVSSFQMEQIVDLLLQSKGKLFLTGVGKSGHIAQKVAATLTSTGTPAFFLPPSDALHGDLGMIEEKDLVIMFSKSGESIELLHLIDPIRQKKALIISLVSSLESTLAQEADFSILLPVQKELCPYDIAPTTSTIIQLIFGDCLAMALMQKKKFSLLEFATNHPAGLIGRKIALKVSDLMLEKKELPLCQKSDILIDLLHELSTKRCGCLLVVEKEQLLGIFTDGDLRRILHQMGSKGLSLPIEKVMTTSYRWTQSSKLAIDALAEMEKELEHPITVLPVIEKDHLVGLIRMHDILQAGLKPTPTLKRRITIQ